MWRFTFCSLNGALLLRFCDNLYLLEAMGKTACVCVKARFWRDKKRLFGKKFVFSENNAFSSTKMILSWFLNQTLDTDQIFSHNIAFYWLWRHTEFCVPKLTQFWLALQYFETLVTSAPFQIFTQLRQHSFHSSDTFVNMTIVIVCLFLFWQSLFGSIWLQEPLKVTANVRLKFICWCQFTDITATRHYRYRFFGIFPDSPVSTC